MINIVFLFIYVALLGSIPAIQLYYIFSFQCVLLIITYVRKHKKVSPILLYYVSLIIVNYANIKLIDQIGTSELQINYIIPRYINEAAELWCISSTIIIMGYHWNADKSLPSIGFEIGKAKTLEIIFWMLLIFNLSGSLSVAKSGLLNYIIGPLNSIGILFFARLWGKQNNTKYRTYALVLAVLETYVALTTAFLRFELILPTICLFLGYFIGKGSSKYVFSYRIIPFLLIVLLYSSVFKRLQDSRSNFISVFVDNNNNESDDDTNTKNSGALLARNSNVAQMTNVVNMVKKNGFYGGKVSEPLLIALIPRFLWPDKPKIALGQWFALAIGGDDKKFGGKSTNSINMTMAGELYLDFGWIGLIIGSFFIGALIPLFWNSTGFYTSEYNLAGNLYGGYLLILSMGNYGGDLQVIITLTSSYLCFLIIKRLLNNKI